MEHKMSDISLANAKIIDDLVVSYKKLNKLEKALLPQGLKILLKQHAAVKDKMRNVLDIINAVMDTILKTKFSILKNLLESPLYQTCELLEVNKLFTEENIFVVLAHPNPSKLFSALRILDENKLLKNSEGAKNCAVVIMHQIPDKLARALLALNDGKILSDNNRLAVAQQIDDPSGLAAVLNKMTSLGLLIGENADRNLEAAVRHSHPASLDIAIATLHALDEELQNKFEIISQAKSTYASALALIELQEEKISTREIKEQLIADSQPGQIVTNLLESQKTGMNNNAFFKGVVSAETDTTSITHGLNY